MAQIPTFPTPPSLYNTSFSFTVPIASIDVNSLNPFEGTGIGVFTNMPNMILLSFALISLVVGGVIIALGVFTGGPPVARSGSASGSSFFDEGFFGQGLGGTMGDLFMNYILNNMDEMPSLSWDECLQRTVCEANATPKRYGLMGLPFQLFFHPQGSSDSHDRISKYQLAARYGKTQDPECGREFKCIVNPLEILIGLPDFYNRWKPF